METKANHVLIGAFTLLATTALLLFALWAAKYSSEKSWQMYSVVFDEPVTGLSEGSLVQQIDQRGIRRTLGWRRGDAKLQYGPTIGVLADPRHHAAGGTRCCPDKQQNPARHDAPGRGRLLVVLARTGQGISPWLPRSSG